MKWMEELEAPSNLIEASYNQYLCQCYYVPPIIYWAREIACFILYVLYLIRPNNNVLKNIYSN